VNECDSAPGFRNVNLGNKTANYLRATTCRRSSYGARRDMAGLDRDRLNRILTAIDIKLGDGRVLARSGAKKAGSKCRTTSSRTGYSGRLSIDRPG